MFFDFFSPPSSLGISITDDTVSMVQLSLDGELISHGNILLEDGTVRSGKILDKEKLADKIRECLSTAQPKAIQADSKNLKTVVGFPEANVFLYASRLPMDSQGVDFVSIASAEASAIVPFNSQDMSWFYKRFEEKALVAGVLKEAVESYTAVFQMIGLSSVAFDADSVALGRSLSGSPSLDTKPYMIVDIGARSSFLVIFDRHGMINLSVTASASGSEMGMVAQEIKDACAYYNTQFDESVAEVILSGDPSYIPNADSFLTKELGLPVRHGNPFGQLKATKTLSDISPHLSYARAVGFALRNLPSGQGQLDIDFGSV